MRPTDLSKHERTDVKFAALSHVRVYDGVSGYKYEDILLRLNFLKLNLRDTHPDAPFLIYVLKFIFVIYLNTLYQQIEVGRACGTHGRGEKSAQGFGRKARRKETLARPRRRWEDGIRMDLREIGWGRCGLDSTGSV
jgi:hypothetical protein